MDPNKTEQQETRDYTTPIARTGEQQFACILRNRSGESAGEIDCGIRDIDGLSDYDQQAVVDTALAIYLGYVDRTGKRGLRAHEIIKARKGTGAALRKYWAAVKAGKIKRRKRRPNNESTSG